MSMGGDKMLQEYFEIFSKMLDEKGDRIITDIYVPKDGTYRLIEISDNSFHIVDTLEIYNDKKNHTIVGKCEENYHYLSMLDYYSKLVDMNKPIDSSKIIHTNNYLSFAVKKESIINKKLTDEVIDNYYNVLKNPRVKYEKKAKTKRLYEKIEENEGKPDIDLIERIQDYVKSEDVWKDIALDKKDYLKLFFVFPVQERTKEIYIRENKRYLIPNVFNNNEFNIEKEETIFGLSNNNMGMNSKKPYLENKTRKIPMPNLISQEKALIQNQMFDYFMAQLSEGKNNIYLDNKEERIKGYSNIEEPDYLQSGYYIKIKKEKNEVSIQQAEVITDYNPNLQKPFVLKKYMDLADKTLDRIKETYEKDYTRVWHIKNLLDEGFFEGKLKYSFDTEAKELSFRDNTVKQYFLLCRDQLMNWFWKGMDCNLCNVLDKVTIQLINNSVLHNQSFQAQHQFNIRWSLLEFLKEERVGEKVGKIRSELKNHIDLAENIEWEFSNSDEYAYAVGQIISYLFSLSNAKGKNDSIINGFLNAKNVRILRNRIEQMYKKYNYKIFHDTRNKFQKMLAAVMEYEPECINSEMIMAGFVANSLIYDKKNNESEDMKDE